MIVVAWHNPKQRDKFLEAWRVTNIPRWLILQQDGGWKNCARTKNLGIEQALAKGAKRIVVLDDDCYPDDLRTTLATLEYYHELALDPQPVEMYEAVTDPPSRGTPYYNRTVNMPVAASMGFWTNVPDYDAPSQLVRGTEAMTFKRKAMFGRFFPFSGMNCAFRSEFWPHFKFDEEADRFDDIFMGYRLQAEAYKRGHCINLNGPLVRHSRQSNVWHNLKVEAENLERNETEWQKHV